MKGSLLILALSLFAANLFAQTNENNCFIGIVMGPSIPLGDFADNSPANENADYAKTGYSDSFINFGYKIYKNFGVCASFSYNQYDVDKSGTDTWWMLVGIAAGPMFSFPVKNKFYFDLKPKLGYMLTNLVIDGYANEVNMGSGGGIDLRASFRYNFARRWCILTEAGYIYTNQKFPDGRKKKMQAITPQIGIAYRFNIKAGNQ